MTDPTGKRCVEESRLHAADLNGLRARERATWDDEDENLLQAREDYDRGRERLVDALADHVRETGTPPPWE